MISASEVRRLRRQTFRPSADNDTDLIATAQSAAEAGRPYYGTIQNPTTQDIYRYLSEFVGKIAELHAGRPAEEITVLDWGGGKGYVTYFLRQMGFDVTLFETKDFPHKDFWEKFDLPVKTADSTSLPFTDKTFDIVVGFGVLEHVPYDYEALKELNRVLKDDGLLLCFNLPNQLGWLHYAAAWRGVKYHDRLYGSHETQRLLKRVGFNTIGRPWRRQLFPKNSMHYKNPGVWERLDLALCRYTPLRYFATSLEFVARKQYTYTAKH